MRLNYNTNLLCRCANENWGPFETGDEDGHELLQKSGVDGARNVVLEIIAQLGRRFDFDFHI